MDTTTSTNATTAQTEPQWGRLIIVGGTDWPILGRKGDKEKTYEPHPDLITPHFLRPLRTSKITSVHTSSCSSHAVAIDIHGVAHLWGRAASSALGLQSINAVWEDGPMKIRPEDLGCPTGVKFVSAATGRAHTVLVASDGACFSAGLNNSGQCGQPVCPEVAPFKKIIGPWVDEGDKVIQAGCGITFTIVLTASGKVYAMGSGERGQLGNGRTGEHIVTSGRTVFDSEDKPILVKGLNDRKIVQISAGPQHSLAVDSNGYILVWGCAGYCRLGLGNQQDTLIPKPVPAFSGDREISRGASVYAGPTCSAVIDRSGMYWLAGKWKISGDGSAGQPWSSFRFVQDIMSCKCTSAAFGGVTLWALAPEENGKSLVVGWGQNAVNGELGMGEDKPKSATKPIQVETLLDLDIFQMAAGAHTTYFLAKPNDKLSELPIHPELSDLSELCIVCEQDKGENDSPLECEKCERPFHLGCLSPPLTSVPEGEWFCDECQLHSEPHYLSAPNVLKDTSGANGEDGGKGKKGKGRPKKNAEPVVYAEPPVDDGYLGGDQEFYNSKRKAPMSDDENDEDYGATLKRKKTR